MLIILLLLAVVLLAWSNGANDNFKGVATLYGSGTASYRVALAWATASTIAGTAVSVLFAAALAQVFSGKGLIPDNIAAEGPLLVAVGTGGAVTILLATILGMPTSTTHALTGALVGAGLVAAPLQIGWSTLLTKFAQPLLMSPLIAIAAASLLYLIFTRTRKKLGVERETCICVVEEEPAPVEITVGGGVVARDSSGMRIIRVKHGITGQCVERYEGAIVGINAQRAVDTAHYASAGAVCFARAVNDTPKIAALLLAASFLDTWVALLIVGVPMAVGGILYSRRVAETMSKGIADMNSGQGLTANLVTAGLVLIATRLGLPVSTTHVSCSSIFGIGIVNKKLHWKPIAQIGVTWVTTLPLGLAIGAATYALLRSMS